jgi:hypothetical protein
VDLYCAFCLFSPVSYGIVGTAVTVINGNAVCEKHGIDAARGGDYVDVWVRIRGKESDKHIPENQQMVEQMTKHVDEDVPSPRKGGQ